MAGTRPALLLVDSFVDLRDALDLPTTDTLLVVRQFYGSLPIPPFHREVAQDSRVDSATYVAAIANFQQDDIGRAFTTIKNQDVDFSG